MPATSFFEHIRVISMHCIYTEKCNVYLTYAWYTNIGFVIHNANTLSLDGWMNELSDRKSSDSMSSTYLHICAPQNIPTDRLNAPAHQFVHRKSFVMCDVCTNVGWHFRWQSFYAQTHIDIHRKANPKRLFSVDFVDFNVLFVSFECLDSHKSTTLDK